MSVSPEVSLQAIESELALVHAYATAVGLRVDVSPMSTGQPRFYVEFSNARGEPFFVEIDCPDYPMYPPTVEFVGGDRSERGTKKLYPQGFHPTPCVCMRYNRKAYKERGGPHGDWRLLDWRLPTSNGIGVDSLALIVSDLHSKICQSEGRMG